MNKTAKIGRWILGVLLLFFGVTGSFQLFVEGYDPQNEGILLFGDTFQDLHNAIMMSYLGPVIRLSHVLIGALLLTKKYWWIAQLIHLPIAFNIFCIHIFHDLPTAQIAFFSMGMIVSLGTFLLVFLERKRFSSWVINSDPYGSQR